MQKPPERHSRHTLRFLGRSGSARPADSSFLGGSSLPFGRPKRCKNLRSGTAGTLFVSWGFKPAVWQPSRVHKLRSSTAQPAHSSFLGDLKGAKTSAAAQPAAAEPGRQTLLFLGVQACHLAGLKGAKTSAAAQPAHSSFLGASSLPFGSLQGCTRSGLKGAKTSAAQPAHSSLLGPTPTATERAERSNSQPVPPPRKGGVGGTRALAHSIKQDKTRYKTR